MAVRLALDTNRYADLCRGNGSGRGARVQRADGRRARPDKPGRPQE